jgi:hypothetical protein
MLTGFEMELVKNCFPELKNAYKTAKAKKQTKVEGSNLLGKCFPSQWGVLKASLQLWDAEVTSWMGRDGKRSIFVTKVGGLTTSELEGMQTVVAALCET